MRKTIPLTNYEKSALRGAKDLGWFNPSEESSWFLFGTREQVWRPLFVAKNLYKKGFMEFRPGIPPDKDNFRVLEEKVIKANLETRTRAIVLFVTTERKWAIPDAIEALNMAINYLRIAATVEAVDQMIQEAADAGQSTPTGE